MLGSVVLVRADRLEKRNAFCESISDVCVGWTKRAGRGVSPFDQAHGTIREETVLRRRTVLKGAGALAASWALPGHGFAQGAGDYLSGELTIADAVT